MVASPWDFDIGAGLQSDYIFRGITQSAHGPSVNGHGELRYNVDTTWQLYGGVSGESINFNANNLRVPGSDFLLGSTYGNPSMELDGDAGIRGTFDKFSFDLGGIVYGYPNTPAAYWPRPVTWGEVYIKPSYTVADWLTVGANFNYTPSYEDTGANGEYVSGTFKATLPGQLSAFSISGEFGRQFLGTVDEVISGDMINGASIDKTGFAAQNVGYALGKLPSYDYFNIGASYAWKFVTFDVRFYGTDLSKADAAQLWGVAGYDEPLNASGQNQSSWGRDAIVGSISFDLGGKDIK